MCLTISLLLGACTDESGRDADADADAEPRGLGECPKCQLNAAQVNGAAISYLDLSGEPNEQGIVVAFVRDPDGEIYDFGVIDEEMAAYERGQLMASGPKMIGWELVLLIDDVFAAIRITGHGTLPSLAKNGAPISVYALETVDEFGKLINICPGKPLGAAAATILHGETYDAGLKVIDKSGPQWITLACADEAIFKVKRLGYGPGGNQGPKGSPATPAQRTATLKMVTADYCGTGHSFTANQVKVNWRNVAGTVSTSDVGLFVQYEAVWTEKGASCIGKPRYVPKSEVAQYCQLPTCTQYLQNSPAPYEWQTLVPYYF
jgi:hypothetical protein